MNHLTLKLIKEHLNLDNDFTLDDDYLTNLGNVVETVVERHIDDSFTFLASANGGNLPTPLIQAMLLLLGTYYANREHIAFNANYEVGNSYTFLIDLYRNYSASHSDSSNYTLINSIDELMKKNKEMNDKLEDVKSSVNNNSKDIIRINEDLPSIMNMASSAESNVRITRSELETLQSNFETIHRDMSDLQSIVDVLNNKTLQGTDSVEVTENGTTTTLEVNQINGGKF